MLKAMDLFSFAENTVKNISKNISKNLIGKYSQKCIVHAQKLAEDALKAASKRAIQKLAEATGDLIEHKNADKISSKQKFEGMRRIQNLIKIIRNTKRKINTTKKGQQVILNLDGQKIVYNQNGISKTNKSVRNTTTQPSKFRKKNWVEIIDDACGTQNTNSQIKFKNTMLKSRLCDYSDSYILVKGTITITRAGTDAAARQADETNTTIFKYSTI